MVTLLFIALVTLAIIGIGLYLWQRPRHQAEYVLPPPPPLEARGLFQDDKSIAEAEAQRLQAVAAENVEALLARAREREREALKDADATGDLNLYNRVLDELVARANSDQSLLALMSYVAQNELPVSVSLAQAVNISWQTNPDRNLTSKALHFAALSDNAELYRQTIEHSLQLWRDGKLADVSALELRALFDGEFWILSARSRSSGAGFVLKRSLDSARRELEAAATIGSPRVSKGDQSNEALPIDHPVGGASDTN